MTISAAIAFSSLPVCLFLTLGGLLVGIFPQQQLLCWKQLLHSRESNKIINIRFLPGY
jgi:hypothetical protein